MGIFKDISNRMHMKRVEKVSKTSERYSNRTEYTTEHGNCIRLEPLPEELKNLDTITVTVDVRSSIQYWYMDRNGEGRVYSDGSSVQSTPMSFELERSEKNG